METPLYSNRKTGFHTFIENTFVLPFSIALELIRYKMQKERSIYTFKSGWKITEVYKCEE